MQLPRFCCVHATISSISCLFQTKAVIDSTATLFISLPGGKLFCHYLTKCLILRKSLFKSQIKFACANNPSNTCDTSISTIYRKGKSLQPNVWMGKFSRLQLNSTSYVHTSSPVKSNLFGESLKSEPKCVVSL